MHSPDDKISDKISHFVFRSDVFCVSGRWTAVLSDLWGVLAADV